MFRFRELLFFVGVLRLILGADPYTYPSYPGAPVYSNAAAYSGVASYPNFPADASYGYSQYGGMPAYSSYGQAGYGANAYGGSPYGGSPYGGYNNNGYGTNAYGNGKGYGGGTNCSALRVIDVLDQIFCQHGRRMRYSTNIYQYTGLIIRQLEYIMEFVFLQAAYDYLGAAVQTLQTIQDSLYNNFEHSSLLNSYEGFGKPHATPGTASSGSREEVKAKTDEARTKIKTNEQNAQMFKTNKGMTMQPSASQVQTSQQAIETHTKSEAEAEAEVKKRSTFSEINLAGLGINADPKRADKINKLKKRMAHLQTEARNESRKARNVESSDNSCTYVDPATCDYDKYDELLYNLLVERFFTALDFIGQACDETWFFMDEISCEDDWDRWALIEAAAVYGSIVTDSWTLFDEVIIPIEEMYELIELEYDGQGRAGGDSSDSYPQQQQQPSPTSYKVPMMRRPPQMSNGRPPMYSISQYTPKQQSQSLQYSGYSPSRYRVGRGAAQPTLVSHRAPSWYVVG